MSRILTACVIGLGLTAAGVGHHAAHAATHQDVRPVAAAPSARPPARDALDAGSVRPVLRRYCVGCHNARLRTAGLALDTMDPARVGDHPAAWEKVVRKLRTGAMPPAGRRRPDAATYEAVAAGLETALDQAAASDPDPGRTTVHRLNRREYANAVRDLLALEIDATRLLPADNADLGFDNMADILSVSPALLDRYLFAARRISRLAVGDSTMEPTTETHVVPAMRFQDQRMDEDLPFGSRGGIAIRHNFPLDAEYDVSIRLQRQLYDYVRGLQNRQQLEVRLDGERVALFDIGGAPGTPPPRTFAGAVLGDRTWEEYTLHADEHLSVRISAKAGPRVLGVSFVQGRSERDGVLQPRATGKVLAIAERWSSPSEAPEAAVDQVSIAGPFNATGAGETPSRERLFVCRPAPGAGDEACAREILATVAQRAFRRPVTEADLGTLLAFFAAGRRTGGFETGVQRALESILVDPEFLFRVERDPVDTRPGTIHPISDLELASRLSFFLWSSIPDDELLDIAARGELRDTDVLQRQIRRMLADPPRAGPRRRLCCAVAGPANPVERRADAGALPGVGRQPARGVRARDGAVRGQPDPRGSQRPGPRSRGLHVRQRAAGPALWNSERLRQPVPAGDVPRRRTRRPARTRQYPDRHVLSHADLSGAAGALAAVTPARRAAAATAAGRAGAAGPGRGRQTGLGARAAGAAPREPGLRELSCADGSARLRPGTLRCHREVARHRRGRRTDRRIGRFPPTAPVSKDWRDSGGSC